MTYRDTSAEAFISIKSKLSDRQQLVYGLLLCSFALTNSEIAKELDWKINTVTPRTNELVKYGLVQAFGKRKCRVTGRNAYAWGVAKDRPAMLVQSFTKADAIPIIRQKLVPITVMVDGIRMTRLVPEYVYNNDSADEKAA